MNKSFTAKIIRYFIFTLMGIQILIGFVWMFRNITAIPLFGDSSEYLNLSDTFALDEYRPVLYPLILRIIREVEERIYIPYQIMLYVMQTVVSYFSILFSISVLDKLVLKTERTTAGRWGLRCFFAGYLMTIPMITFMNYSVLTDSLAASMLLLALTGLMYLLYSSTISIRICALVTLSLIAECLLRADRLYSCMLLTVIVFLVRLFKNSKVRKQSAAAMLAVCLIVTGTVKGVNYFTQTPGINGRIQTTLDFVLLDRIVWPNMEANYSYFSQEIRDTITEEDARTFDKHNNNVMYQMAPLLEEKVGKEKAQKMYREMAAVVFTHQPVKVLGDIGEDILAMLATPVSSFLNSHGKCEKGDSWNIYCMSSVTPNLTTVYNSYYQYTFLLLLLIGILISIYAAAKKESRNLRILLRKMMPFWCMGIILALWFSVGDGAPPNDRYALLIYYNWSVFVAGLLGA